MKVLVLKTVSSKMTACGGFVWPTSGFVECPDWNPVPKCGGGLHGLLWGEGNQGLLDFSNNAKWLVLEVESEEIVDIYGKVKFPRCNVIYCGNMKGAAKKILSVRPESNCPGSGRSCCYVDSLGDEYWYKDGELHRDNGPAVEGASGYKAWYNDGNYHRDDGPAIEYVNGGKEWWVKGEKLTEKEFNKTTNSIQKRIGKWVSETLGEEQKEAGISPLENIVERCDRFVEEALELAQAIGLSKETVHKRVDYVFSRPKGDIAQEIGGSLLTLYAVSESCEVDADAQVLKEVERVETPEIREKVRRRQKEKREVVK